MRTVSQISVIIDNAPGTLARIGESLREHAVNVQGFTAWGESDHGIVRMICDRPLKALDLLEEAGMIALQHDVLEVPLRNQPGALYAISLALSEAGVNINYAYGSNAGQEGDGMLYLSVSDLETASQVLDQI